MFAEALSFIDASIPRDEWVAVLGACKSASLSFDEVLNWSRSGANFKSEADVRQAWGSVQAGVVPAEYLYKLARAQGWKGNTTQRPAKAPVIAVEPPPDNLEQIEAIMLRTRTDAECGGKIAEYLRNRGLNLPVPGHLRHSVMDYWQQDKNGKNTRIGAFDAMVTPITNGRDFRGVHITYLKDGHKLTGYDAKKMRTRRPGALRGAAVQLYQPTERRLAVAEGIETALAVHQFSGLPVWACLSANGIRRFEWPPIRELMIYADNDANGVGLKAAEELRDRASAKGIQVEINLPPEPGKDWLDMLLEGYYE